MSPKQVAIAESSPTLVTKLNANAITRKKTSPPVPVSLDFDDEVGLWIRAAQPARKPRTKTTDSREKSEIQRFAAHHKSHFDVLASQDLETPNDSIMKISLQSGESSKATPKVKIPTDLGSTKSKKPHGK
ncbi:hypothetical protein Scep_024126 [Stephania cephalantha]|uniref:Uncharacterized protein n=1 Tax=Stephania cephalantha TaxID=152367 RepID=A0AAP0HXZ2_9MAGN